MFAKYLSRVFNLVKKEVNGCMATSFAEHCGSLVIIKMVEQQCEYLVRADIKAVK